MSSNTQEKEEKVKTYEDYRDERLFMKGCEFIDHLNDIMVGKWVMSKNSVCIRQTYLTEKNWSDLISQYVGKDAWEGRYCSDWDCLFDDGGLMREDYDTEIVSIARDVAEQIDYTLPTIDGVYVAMRNRQYYEMYFLKD